MKPSAKYHHLPLEDKERLFAWFKSQQQWHERQQSSVWHRRQRQWFKNQAAWVFTFSDIVSRTIRRRTPEIIANLITYNAFLRKVQASFKE